MKKFQIVNIKADTGRWFIITALGLSASFISTDRVPTEVNFSAEIKGKRYCSPTFSKKWLMRKIDAFFDHFPGFVWRTMHCCDNYGRAFAGQLEFWWYRKNAYKVDYGDCGDNVGSVPFFKALHLKYKNETRWSRHDD